MELSTKACGLTTKPTARVRSGMFTGISIAESGLTIRRMESEPIHMQTELGMRGIGRTTYSMDGA